MLPRKRTTFQLWAVFTIVVFFLGTMTTLYGVDRIRRAASASDETTRFYINTGMMYLNVGVTSMMFLVIYIVFLFLFKERRRY